MLRSVVVPSRFFLIVSLTWCEISLYFTSLLSNSASATHVLLSNGNNDLEARKIRQ